MPVDPDFPAPSGLISPPQPQAQKQFGDAYKSASWDSPPPSPSPSARPVRRFGPLAWVRIAFVLVASVLQPFAILSRSIYHSHQTPKSTRHHQDLIARPDQLVGNGRIYLVQLGPHTDPYSIQELSEWLRDKYSLDTQILQPAALDPAAWDSSRHRYIAERLYAQIKREHPTLAADPKVWLIGFTDAEMYSVTRKRSATFSQRDGQRAAIISSFKIEDSPMLRGWLRLTTKHYAPKSSLRDRLRRILLKDVAVLFWHLPLNNDPGSLLYFSLNPNVLTNDIYESDLAPTRSPSGEFISDPCIVFTYAARSGVKPTPKLSAGSLIRECEVPENPDQEQSSIDTPNSPPDTSQERIELRLHYGLLTEKHTDFYLPGQVPIRFERATSNRWLMPMAFGISGSHNYDRYLSSHDAMRHITISNAGSGDDVLVRVPKWLSFLAINKWIDVDASGSNLSLRWRNAPTPHFDLTRFNGEVESYMPCVDSELCYLNGYRSSNGGVLTMLRDSHRRLTSLSAPQNSWLHINYNSHADAENRITDILDSRGRHVGYSYNSRNQLATVTYPSGEVLSYTYDELQNLVSVSVAADAEAAPTVLITNHFRNGRLVSQLLADGSTYSYDYFPSGGGQATMASVHAPNGTIYDLSFGTEGAAVRQRTFHAVPNQPADRTI